MILQSLNICFPCAKKHNKSTATCNMTTPQISQGMSNKIFLQKQ